MLAKMRALPVLIVLVASACAGPTDRIILVRGELVDETGRGLRDCAFALFETHNASDRFAFRTDVGGQFEVAITYWVRGQSKYEIAIECPEAVASYRFGPLPVPGVGAGPIDLGRVTIHRAGNGEHRIGSDSSRPPR